MPMSGAGAGAGGTSGPGTGGTGSGRGTGGAGSGVGGVGAGAAFSARMPRAYPESAAPKAGVAVPAPGVGAQAVIGTCPGWAATRASQAPTFGWPLRSKPASGATWVYANSAMSAIVKRSATR